MASGVKIANHIACGGLDSLDDAEDLGISATSRNGDGAGRCAH